MDRPGRRGSGPASNKMGGIWNVVDAEATTLARLVAKGEIDSEFRILVAGPNYPAAGSDWNAGRNRVTDISSFNRLEMGEELGQALAELNSMGIESITGQRVEDGVPIGYVLFNTNYYQSRLVRWKNQEMTLNNAIKTEAFTLLGLDSMRFEKEHYGGEYNHYLNLSYAVSELVRNLAQSRDEGRRSTPIRRWRISPARLCPRSGSHCTAMSLGFSMLLPGWRSWAFQ